jgi:hypothetical protein
VDVVALGQVFSKYFTFPSVSFHQRSTLTFLTLLLSEWQTGYTIEASKQVMFFSDLGEHWKEK